MASAIPAKKCWTKVMQSDGSVISVTLVGDEHLHYYTTADGVALCKDADNRFCYLQMKNGIPVSSKTLAHEASLRTDKERAIALRGEAINALANRKIKPAKNMMKSVRQSSSLSRLPQNPNSGSFIGKKKAPVILAYFTDKSFAEGNEQAKEFYDNVLNQEGFSQYGAAGSVHDYFKDMSRGVFDLSFDVIGPVKVSKSATYYGGPSVLTGGTDHIGEFITEAIKNADAQYDIDWAQYDWNGDGEVEQVFVVYAGYGRATGGPNGTIWPNAWTLDDALQNNDGNGGFSLGGVYINQYACSNELYNNSGKTPMGLGVFCHEFSHCMGLPDMYDTNYGSTPTMGAWDLLASGSYNGPNGIGWCPAGWTSYERAYAGWLDPIELQPGDKITGMTDLEDAEGNAYVIYNDNHNDEFYLLENHKNKGWDAYTPESGLLVIHVDYDKDLFRNNIVNTKGEFTTAEGYDMNLKNDHPRMAPFSKIRSISNETYYYTYPIEAPRGTIDSLTDNSKPAAELYNALANGTKLMGKPIYNIKKDATTGDISFNYMTKEQDPETAIADIMTDGSDSRGERIYDITGKFIGKRYDRNGLKAGIYIVTSKNGHKKIIVN